MNVSNAAYNKPTTVYKPGLQKEGIDYSIEGENAWYEPVEKVIPRVYHKYLKAEDLENIYGPTEEVEPDNPDEGGGDDNQNVEPNPQENDPNQNVDPQNPDDVLTDP